MPSNSESLLISSILRDQDFTVALGAGINKDQFHSFPDEWEFLENYFRRYRKMPTKIAFKGAFPDFRIVAVNDTGHYAHEVAKSHTRYRLTASMRDVTNFIADGNIDQAVKLMYAEIVTISAEVGTGGEVDVISNWESMYREAKEKADRVATNGSAGIPTGFATLDERTGGPQPGEFWVVGARLGGAKSWTLVKMSCSALAIGKKVQYNTMEMSRSQVGMRMHALLSSKVGQQLFSNLDLQQGKNFSPADYKRFLRDLKAHIKGAFYVTDGSRGKTSPLTIAAQIERNRPDIVFIDYLTLMDGANGEWKNIGKITGDIKQLAQQYQIPIIGAAQLNRERGLGKGPAGPEALAQSDSIGQDADAVITCHRPSESTLEMKMAKYRHGPGGFKWHCDFRPSLGIFQECTYEHAQMLRDKDADADDAETVRQVISPVPQGIVKPEPRPQLKRPADSSNVIVRRSPMKRIGVQA